MLKIGDKAPDFTLLDQNGKAHKLSDYQKQFVLLYFYPKDDTPGCTKEACNFRDNFSEFKKLNTVIFGISTDPVKSHGKFVSKYNLPFDLLSDEKKEVVTSYFSFGKKKFMGREYEGTLRNSFLIDKSGSILKIYENVKPDNHFEEVLEDLRKLEN